MHVLIAFDKFKDSMTAPQACSIASEVIQELRPDWTIECAPLADGGEGFCEILTQSVGGELIEHTVLGPQLMEQKAHWGLVENQNIPEGARERLNLSSHGTLAIIEMAQASGIESIPMDKRDPWIASTYGTGQLIAEAANKGAQAILLGLGGSATNDIGLGALEAVGLELLDDQRMPMKHVIPKQWNLVKHIGGDIWPHIPPIAIACDVENPLLGPMGCTAIFGPQKGLQKTDQNVFEKQLGTLAKKLCKHFAKPEMLMAEKGAGAAGGIGFGLMVGCDAQLCSGFELVESWLQLKSRVRKANLIITGEGSFDPSSLQGKGPGSIIKDASTRGKTSIVLAGRVDENMSLPNGVKTMAISEPDLPLAEALQRGPQSLAEKLKDALLQLPSG